MRSWKTTFAAGAAALAGFVVFANSQHLIEFPPWMVAAAGYIQMGGLAALGISAKDYNVSGDKPPSQDNETK
jgi:hypothetical protein